MASPGHMASKHRRQDWIPGLSNSKLVLFCGRRTEEVKKQQMGQGQE